MAEPLGLVACLGMTPPGGLIVHPDGLHVVYSLGSTVVLRRRDDPSDQKFLRGHTDQARWRGLSWARQGGETRRRRAPSTTLGRARAGATENALPRDRAGLKPAAPRTRVALLVCPGRGRTLPAGSERAPWRSSAPLALLSASRPARPSLLRLSHFASASACPAVLPTADRSGPAVPHPLLTTSPLQVTALSLSESGKYLASGQRSHPAHKAAIIVWDLETLAPVARCALHRGGVAGLAFGPDVPGGGCLPSGQDGAAAASAELPPAGPALLASLGGSDDNSIALWSLPEGARALCGAPASVSSDSAARHVAFLPSDPSFPGRHGARLVTAGVGHVDCWALDEGGPAPGGLPPRPARLVRAAADLGGLVRRFTSLSTRPTGDGGASVFAGTETGDVVEVRVLAAERAEALKTTVGTLGGRDAPGGRPLLGTREDAAGAAAALETLGMSASPTAPKGYRSGEAAVEAPRAMLRSRWQPPRGKGLLQGGTTAVAASPDGRTVLLGGGAGDLKLIGEVGGGGGGGGSDGGATMGATAASWRQTAGATRAPGPVRAGIARGTTTAAAPARVTALGATGGRGGAGQAPALTASGLPSASLRQPSGRGPAGSAVVALAADPASFDPRTGAWTALAATADGAMWRVRVGPAEGIAPELVQTAPAGAPRCLAFPPGLADVFACGSEGEVRVWHLDTCRELLRLVVPGLTCTSLCWRDDGTALLTGWSDGAVRAFAPRSGREMWRLDGAHPRGVTAVATAWGGDMLVTGGQDGGVRAWDLAGGCGGEGAPAAGEENPGAARQREARRQAATLRATQAAAARGLPPPQAKNRGAGPYAPRLLADLAGEHSGAVSSLSASRDGRECVSAAADGRAVAWDLSAFRRRIVTRRGAALNGAGFCRDDSQLVTAGGDRQLAYVDAAEGGEIRRCSPEGSAGLTAAGGVSSRGGALTCLALDGGEGPDGDGEQVATGDEAGAVTVWGYDAGVVTHRGDGHAGAVTAVAWAPDGTRLVTAGGDGGLLVWDAPRAARQEA